LAKYHQNGTHSFPNSTATSSLLLAQDSVIYFPKAGTCQNIKEYLTAKARKSNKDTCSDISFLTFAFFAFAAALFQKLVNNKAN
jgi:hypothetical protein